MKKNMRLMLIHYFNDITPNHKILLWKAAIKKIIGWQKIELEKNAIIENNIYRKL